MQRGSGVRIVYFYFVLSCSRGISPVHVRVLGAIVSRYLFNTDISYHFYLASGPWVGSLSSSLENRKGEKEKSPSSVTRYLPALLSSLA